MKRVFSFLLALLLVAGLVPVQANAATNNVMGIWIDPDSDYSGVTYTTGEIETWAPIVVPDGKVITYIEQPVGDTSGSLQVKQENGIWYVWIPNAPNPEIAGQVTDGNNPQTPHNIIVKVEGSGSAYASPATAKVGETVTIHSDPDNFYDLSTITVVGPDGHPLDFNWDCKQFTMPEGNVTVTVKFTAAGDSDSDYSECYVTYDYCVGGNPFGKPQFEKVTPGSNYSFTAPDGYVIDRITDINNAPVTASGNHSIVVPEGGISVYIWLTAGTDGGEAQPTLYNVTVEEADNGAVTATPTQAEGGTTITVTARPDRGYKAGTISVTALDGTKPVTVTDGTFTMPAYDVKVAGTFEPLTIHNIDILTPEHGTVTLEPDPPYAGEEVRIKAEPDPGYEVEKIIVTFPDGGEEDVTEEKKFTMPNGDIKVEVTFTIQINFDYNDGSMTVDTKQIDDKGKVEDVPSPSNDKALFTGWYTSPDGGERVTEEDIKNGTYSASTTFYAHWAKVIHTTNSKPDKNAFNATIALSDEAIQAMMSYLIKDEDSQYLSIAKALDSDLNVHLDSKKAVPEADKTILASKADGKTIAAYVDLTFNTEFVKAMNNSRSISNPGSLPIILEPGELMDLPANLTSDSFRVLRLHEGAVTELGAHFDTATKNLTFTTDRFSTYAIVYTPNATAASTYVLDNVPKTGDSSALPGWMLMILCSAAMLTGVAVIDKKRAR